MTVSPSNGASERDKARLHIRNKDLLLAEQSYWRLLQTQPNDMEAIKFLAMENLARGEDRKAVELLMRAKAIEPNNPAVLHELAVAQLEAGDVASAIENLRLALQLSPRMFVARLRLAAALEQLSQGHEAFLAYFQAINDAQLQGRWLSDSTTAPALRQAVKYAMEFVDLGRRRFFENTLAPLRQRYGRSELARVDRCLAIYLNEEPANLPDPRQKPRFLYFPDLPSQPFYSRSRFPWQAELESASGSIQKELRGIMARPGSFESFLGPASRDQNHEHLQSSGEQPPAWDAFFFHRHGDKFEANSALCPRTSKLLDTIPLVHIRDHAPETLFSVLTPGTHIMPHHGVTNTRLVTHLPLIVPPECALRVGGEIHVWKEGQCVTFDDTFEHEAWNRSSDTRVVLIIDSWNPDLSEAERSAVTDLVAAIGDLNRQVGL